MLLADNSACVAIVVVTVVHLDASHSTPTGHTRISAVPHAAYLTLLLIPAPARGGKLWLAVLQLHYYFEPQIDDSVHASILANLANWSGNNEAN